MRKKLLIITILIAAAFRFIGLGHNPPSLNWDEIAIGWNAYSILQTSKDEFGTYLPLTFRSFDDYKSPAYIYATIPALVLFGKTEFAVRFASALTGTLTVLIIYFFTQTLLLKNPYQNNTQQLVWNNRIANGALFTAGILAITPWHVHFSRVAFEANFALFWEILGSWLFLKWIRTENHHAKSTIITVLGAVLSFGIALYSYANARLFILLLLLGWSLYFYKTIWSRKKQTIIALILGVIISIPLIIQMAQGVGFARFQATSIFNRPEVYIRNKEQAVEDYKNGQGRLSVIVHNTRLPVTREIIQNYFDHFNYSFLFVRADLPRHQVPGFGLLYIWQLPLILAGAVFIIKNRKYLDTFLPIWWLAIAPIPAALTWQVPHSIRSELMLPILTLLSGAGLWAILKYIQQQDLATYSYSVSNSLKQTIEYKARWIAPKLIFLLILAFISLSAYSLAANYTTQLPKEFAQNWLYGRKEMVQVVEAEKDKYDQVMVDLSIDWGYLWFLWYGNYSPQWYLDQGGTISGGFEEEQNTVGKIKFKRFDFNPTFFGSEPVTPHTLYIGLPSQFPKELTPYKKILDPAGKPAIYIVKT